MHPDPALGHRSSRPIAFGPAGSLAFQESGRSVPGSPRGNLHCYRLSLAPAVCRPGLGSSRRPGNCLLTEQTGELRPEGVASGKVRPCPLLLSSPQYRPSRHRPRPRVEHNAARRRASQPANAPHLGPIRQAHRPTGSEAGPRCLPAEPSSHASQENHPLRR